MVTVNNTIGVNDTLRVALQKIKPKNNVIVNLVTTIPSAKPNKNQVFIDHKKTLNAEWSTVDFNSRDEPFF